MKKPEYEKLPREFRADYAKFAAVRLALSAVVLAAAAFGCAFLDFSGMKYPAMGRVLLAGAAIAADCVLLGLHRFLRPSWEGTVLSVGAGYKLKAAGEKGKPAKRIIVELEIDRGDPKPYLPELYREDKHAVGDQHINVYQTEAPYKEGDTLVYLRGTKVPARYGVKDAEDLTDPKFVCAFCGEVNELKRERCRECGRTVLR